MTDGAPPAGPLSVIRLSYVRRDRPRYRGGHRPAALSSTTETAAQISLEVYCYTTDVDIPPADAAEQCSLVLPEGWAVLECPFGDVEDPTLTNGIETIEAEDNTYEDRRHVV